MDYECSNCGHRFEERHVVTKDGKKFCPSCKGGAEMVADLKQKLESKMRVVKESDNVG